MRRLYLKPSEMQNDAEYSHVLSNSIEHLFEASATTSLLCEVRDYDGISFACHLDSYAVEEDSIRFVVRLYQHITKAQEAMNALNRIVEELLTKPFSICILPADSRSDYRAFNGEYRIVNIEPVDVQVGVCHSDVKEPFNDRAIPCRSIDIQRK